MKVIILIGMLVATAYAADDTNTCSATTNNACDGNVIIPLSKLCKNCDSNYSGYQNDKSSLLTKFANSLFQKSYDYLMLATNFGTYTKNRPGLEKLFKSMSDKAWENGVTVMEHITRRGGAMNYNEKYADGVFIAAPSRSMLKDEIHALSYALDLEKESAARAHKIHQHFSHVHDAVHYDPEIGHFMEEKFLENDAEVVYKLSGYTNELAKLMNPSTLTNADSSLGIYLFDEYLQKL